MRSKFPLLCLLLIGCIEVTPNGGSTPLPTPGPTPVVPDTQLRRSVAASLTGVPKSDCVKLYGVFTALANYIDAGAKDVESTGQLLQLTQKTLTNVGWPAGRFAALESAIGDGLNAKFRTPKPMDESTRRESVAAFREIAAGCRDGAK